MKKNKAFTFMELIIVVTLIGILSAFAIPNYRTSVRKAHERDMIIQLTHLRAASWVYQSHHESFWGLYGADLDTINSTLKTNILPNDATYTYYGSSPTHFWAKGEWDPAGTDSDFSMEVSEHPLTDPKNPPACANPCCNTGPCTYLGNCCYC
jgi:prepilin-type N-terminal cleavage/methylation domain-containing protein